MKQATRVLLVAGASLAAATSPVQAQRRGLVRGHRAPARRIVVVPRPATRVR